MPFAQVDGIRYFQFDSLQALGVRHGIFTRRGGVSPTPWDALNVGGLVGDDAGRVLENRRRTFQALDCPLESLYDVWQVHSREVVCTDEPRLPQQPHLKADAILTDQPGVTLFMRFADCVPILLYDPKRHVVGLVHAGWVGTVSKVAAYAVQAMQEQYRSAPGDIVAAIGPSIGAHHYEVGQEVIDQVQAAFGQDVSGLLARTNGTAEGKAFLDLWAANRLVLEHSGVRQVELAGICTACHLDDWYSHRGENGRTGRFGALVRVPTR